MEIYAVIMAGGSGTRFWPASRANRPKQFLPIAGEQPLITETWARQHADPAVLERAAKGDGRLDVTDDIFQVPIATQIGVPRIVGTCGNVAVAKRAERFE